MRLTKDEILLIVVVVVALTVGAMSRHYRALHRFPGSSPAVPPAAGARHNPD